MKLVENEIVVYNLYTKEIIMHYEYSLEMYNKLIEIVHNMNECAKLNEKSMQEFYIQTIIYGVQYEDNTHTN